MKAWRKAKDTLKRLGQDPEDRILHHEQDGVFIGHGLLSQIAVKDKVRVSCSGDGAKENVRMEAFIGRFKTENGLLFWEQGDLDSMDKVVNSGLRYYNFIRRHSALGKKSPNQYLKEKGKISL